MSIEYSIEQRKELLKIARTTIDYYLENHKRPDINSSEIEFKQKRGVFVTLHKEDQLRGCIGYPLPISPILDAVIDNSISAAFQDPRFPPLENAELGLIDIEISILTIPKNVAKVEDVQVGRDGIIISGSGKRGLLLPQVPVEQSWDLEQYVSYGCIKAGLPGDEWKRGVNIETFQAEVFGEYDVGLK